MKKAKRIAIEIRAAEIADAEALTRLYTHRNAYAQTLQLPFQSTEIWRRRLTTNDETQHTLVAIVSGELVGNLGMTRLTRPRRAHVGEIGMAVRDDWQGKGVGSALLQAAVDLADNWLGLRRLELRVHADNARASRSIASSASKWKALIVPMRYAMETTWIPNPWRASSKARSSRARTGKRDLTQRLPLPAGDLAAEGLMARFW